jgi:hypothetical protein
MLAVGALVVCWAPAAGAASPATWSAAAPLDHCAATGAVRALFPSDSPGHANGRGAVVWSVPRSCPGGAGVRVAAIGAGTIPGAGVAPRSSTGPSVGLRAAPAASSGPHGQIVLVGSAAGGGGRAVALAGPAEGPFAPLSAPSGFAPGGAVLARGYLGDVALASSAAEGTARGELRVEVDRYYARGFARDTAIGVRGALTRSLSLALDYRSDALAVWAQGSAIYARDLPASGATHPIQRLARTAAHVQIATLLSDDNRAIVAWSEDAGGETRVYLERSASGVRFARPTLLERFRDPDALAPPAPLRLIRLSSESVMLAWAGASAGHWVIRSAPVDLNGLCSVSTLAVSGEDVLLADLVAGPVGDALLLWGEPALDGTGNPLGAGTAMLAARGFDAYPGRTVFAPAETVSAPGAVAEASAAIDPASDRAIVLWRGAHARPEYSVRSPQGGP